MSFCDNACVGTRKWPFGMPADPLVLVMKHQLSCAGTLAWLVAVRASLSNQHLLGDDEVVVELHVD